MGRLLLFFSFLATISSIGLHASVALCRYPGQFGNDLFRLAAAITAAKENHCALHLPDCYQSFYQNPEVLEYYLTVYGRIAEVLPLDTAQPSYPHLYWYDNPVYVPIPYQPGMEIRGFFQTEKYFKSQVKLIRELFSPSQAIEDYLQENFAAILAHPKTVGVHVRTAYYDWLNSNQDPRFFTEWWLAPDIDFYRRAIELFDEDSLFVVCSDLPEWCEKHFQIFDRKFIFVKKQKFIYDFFLLTKCKHNIIMASTFGWWAAYLNENPEKRVIYRNPFFNPHIDHPYNINLCVPGWTSIDITDEKFPAPAVFDDLAL